jgi:flagellar basal body-associated protein FliL
MEKSEIKTGSRNRTIILSILALIFIFSIVMFNKSYFNAKDIPHRLQRKNAMKEEDINKLLQAINQLTTNTRKNLKKDN